MDEFLPQLTNYDNKQTILLNFLKHSVVCAHWNRISVRQRVQYVQGIFIETCKNDSAIIIKYVP